MEWTGVRYAEGPTVEVSTWIDAPPRRVWEFVTDVELMPELSPGELVRVRWLDDGGPVVGARFTGDNERPKDLGSWQTTSRVTVADEPREFAWVVNDPDNPAANWRFTLQPADGGTTLSQRARLGPGPSGLSLFIKKMPDKEQAIVHRRLCELEGRMTTTVAAIKERAERAAV